MRLTCTDSIKHLLRIALAAILTAVTVMAVIAQPPGSRSFSTGSKTNIVFDPANKKNINGNTYIAYVSGTQMKSPANVGRGMINLKDAMLKHTKIDTKVERQIRLSSREIMKLPFVYLAFENGFELTENERDNLRKYLENGGFIMLEQFTLAKEQPYSGSALSNMIRSELGQQARVSRLSNSHQLYHSYFDYPDGPPQGGDLLYQTVESSGNRVTGQQVNYLEGITINGRLVGICSSKRYLTKWLEHNDVQLKFGVNVIVYALTQREGIANR
ncbi:MAG: DUF4159 domain-containing protein [Candidatus Latescibacteria bacterium]|nr:DUF4159 domain-containing protein [Candidatus Latescibacterota bacterium]